MSEGLVGASSGGASSVTWGANIFALQAMESLKRAYAGDSLLRFCRMNPCSVYEVEGVKNGYGESAGR